MEYNMNISKTKNKFNFPLPKVEGGNISYSGTKTAFINFLHNKNT